MRDSDKRLLVLKTDGILLPTEYFDEAYELMRRVECLVT